MGKAKKEKARLRAARQRADPVGLSATSSSLTADAVTNPARRQQLIETLTTGTPTQKAIACHAIAHLLSSTPTSSHHSTSASPFLHPALLARVLSLLFITDYDARLAAAVALHAISSLGQRACAALLKQDALAAVLSLLSNGAVLALERERRGRLLVEGVGVLRDLIENVDSVVHDISASSSAVECLFSLLASPQSTAALQAEVASLLLQAVEDNARLVQLIRATPSALALLIRLLDSDGASMLVRLNVAGVVLQLQPARDLALLTAVPYPSSSASSADASVIAAVERVMAVVCSALSMDVASITAQYLRAVQSERQRMNAQLTAMDHGSERTVAEHDEGKEVDMADAINAAESSMDVERETKEQPAPTGRKPPTAHDVERDSQRRVDALTAEWTAQLDATKLALELLTNLTAPEDEEEDDADEERKDEEKSSNDTSFLSQALVTADCFPLVARALTAPLALEEGEKDEGAAVVGMIGDEHGESVLSMLSSMRGRCAALLTNLILCLPFPIVVPHLPAVLHYAGQRMQQLLSASSAAAAAAPAAADREAHSPLSDAALEEMESLTGLFFVISKQTASPSTAASTSESSPLSSEHVQPLLAILSHPSTPLSVQLNLIDLLPLLPPSSAPNALVCGALLQSLQRAPLCLERVDRSLNALMDLYAEDGRCGDIVVALRVLQTMEDAASAMERMVAGMGGKAEREERRRHMESVRNVRAFLQYKPQHL